MNANPTPEVGQVWADRDERTTHATVRAAEYGTTVPAHDLGDDK